MRKIKSGKIEIGSDEFNPRKGKFRVNMFVDLDVIDEIRKLAESERMPYQTWINRRLRDLVENRSSRHSLSAEDIEKMIDERLDERVSKKALKRA